MSKGFNSDFLNPLIGFQLQKHRKCNYKDFSFSFFFFFAKLLKQQCFLISHHQGEKHRVFYLIQATCTNSQYSNPAVLL